MRLLIQGVIVGGDPLRRDLRDVAQEEGPRTDGHGCSRWPRRCWAAPVFRSTRSWHDGPAIGLDWFLLDLLLMTLIFSPIEVLWPAYPQQSVFRSEWLNDIVYFLSTHLPIQVTSLPDPAAGHAAHSDAEHLRSSRTRWPNCPGWCSSSSRSWWRTWRSTGFTAAFHKMPLLWRFHAIHHSSKALDWIAGSRAHLVEDVVVRGGILIPMMLVFPHEHHRGLPVVREHPCHLGALQFRPDDQVAGAVPDPAAVPPLASHVAEGSHRQELRDPLPVDRQDLRHLLLPEGQVAGYLRPARREAAARLLGAVLLSVDAAGSQPRTPAT